MLEAINHSKDMLQESIKSLSLLEQPDAVSAMTFAPEETFSQIKVLPDHMVLDMKAKQKQVVTFVNPLAHPRTELVSVLVNSEEVMVRGWVSVGGGGGALSGAGDAIHPVLKSHWVCETTGVQYASRIQTESKNYLSRRTLCLLKREVPLCKLATCEGLYALS
jgi:hypothetical protein